MNQYDVTDNGYFGRYGGAYIPEILQKCVEELRINYRRIIDSKDFKMNLMLYCATTLAARRRSTCQRT